MLVAKPYVFESTVQECMAANGANEVKEDSFRLQGVAWIDNVRRALQLPVRTFNTAVVYYHKFRLVHADVEYGYVDAAAAALFTACKIEDTLKKSKDILCAAYNLKVPAAEQLNSDDSMFENHAKTIIGLERLMLEASGFDFRNRYPQKVLIKLSKFYAANRETVGKTAYRMCLDVYRTFVPLKQSSSTMAIACLELSARIHEDNEGLIGEEGRIDYQLWSTSREEVMETLLDLLDLYTHHRGATVIGGQYPLDTFIAIRITLNQEASSRKYPRFTEWPKKDRSTNGTKAHDKIDNDTSLPTSRGDGSRRSSPPSSTTGTSLSGGPKVRAGDRGRDGTVRFMLDPARAKAEKEVVDTYYKVEEEEYVVEEEETPRRNRN
ncbi:MAG: RNA polymerase II C-terminal domain kinase beta subunit [Thelocarpon superellum]|nr:MAG: RNA polymerase II C-terminal domain kinase beta subunit [Thelocarpon superellum]